LHQGRDFRAHDLGLRLTDVQKYNLKSERCRFKGYFSSDTIATPEEQDFLRSDRRVELNAFTAPQFIEWLEAKLTHHLGGERLIPADDEVLENAYRRALALATINKANEGARNSGIDMAKAAKIPRTLRRQLEKALADSPHAWDRQLYEIAERNL
jgi:hypothetical protein